MRVFPFTTPRLQLLISVTSSRSQPPPLKTGTRHSTKRPISHVDAKGTSHAYSPTYQDSQHLGHTNYRTRYSHAFTANQHRSISSEGWKTSEEYTSTSNALYGISRAQKKGVDKKSPSSNLSWS